ncbi:MAG: hypothetical protein KME46_17795 [Brasilonema angustatum HA4187-MV1]|nr:hypothetical protein [Brasilonema angustatum HA4187-MV1]
MFWKFVISALLLPSCLGLEVATASVQKEIQTQPNYEKLGTQVAQQEDWETDAEQLKNHKHHHYKTRRYYRYHRPCPQSYRSYYRRGHHPEYIDYRRRDDYYNRDYQHRRYHPQYIEYRGRDDYYNRYHQHRRYHPQHIYDRSIYHNPYRYYRHGRYDY